MASFKDSFAKARKELGAGKTFVWKGKSYSTNTAEDKPSTQAPKTSPRPKSAPAGLAGAAAGKKAAKEAASTANKIAVKYSTKGSAKAVTGVNTSSAPSKTTVPGRNVTALKKGVTSAVSGAKELMTKGYVSGSAYDMRQAAKKQRTKDVEKALFDQRMQRAEDEEKKAMKGKGGR